MRWDEVIGHFSNEFFIRNFGWSILYFVLRSRISVEYNEGYMHKKQNLSSVFSYFVKSKKIAPCTIKEIRENSILQEKIKPEEMEKLSKCIILK